MAELETREQAAGISGADVTDRDVPRPTVPERMGGDESPEPGADDVGRSGGVGTSGDRLGDGDRVSVPELVEMMVADAHTTFKQTGVNRAGRQIYPHQWTITLRRIQENEQTITYQLTAESLTDPPEPTQQHPLTIEKHTHRYDPRDPLSSTAMAHVRWVSRQNQGVWPEVDTTQV